MKIIEITGEPILHGGQERFIAGVIREIGGEGCRIDVLTPYGCDNDAFRALAAEKGGEAVALGLVFEPGKSRKPLMKPVLDFLRGKGYDIAHIHSGSVSGMAYLAQAAKRAGIRRIIVHSHSTGYPSLKHEAVRILFGLRMKGYVTDYLACSEEAGRVKFLRSVVRDRLEVIPNGIDLPAFARDGNRRRETRKALGIPEGSFVIGHVGRFSEEKNHGFLIRMFAGVRREIPDSFLLLAGDGETRTSVERLVREQGLEGSVLFTGNVENVQDYYQAMDVFCLPSFYEGLSYVTLEAQAAGLPCLLSSGVPKAAAIGEHVFRMPLEEPDEWIRKCVSLAGVKPADNTEKIRAAGYDMWTAAERIRRVYGI